LLRDDKQFWCGTAFSLRGPWRVFEEDRVIMAAIHEECVA
jgi:hypothetical protein